MKIVIAGGSGLIGRRLSARLVSLGHDVVVLTRDGSGQAPGGGVRQLEWMPDGETGPWAVEVDGAGAVVNLAGAGIADKRWTDGRKALLRSSRVLSTRSLVTAVRRAEIRPTVFIQGSAVGFYGIGEGDRELDESFPPGDDFLGELCVSWEAEAHPVSALGCRLVILRTGIVLSDEGGVLGQLRTPFQFFVGGPVASGQQYISWIHQDDLVGLVEWVLSNASASGVFNASAPAPVTNTVFSAALGRALQRPSWLTAPAFALRLLFGELADALLINGQRVVPKHAIATGFVFGHPEIDEAITDVIGKARGSRLGAEQH